jgi:hypothetical protein
MKSMGSGSTLGAVMAISLDAVEAMNHSILANGLMPIGRNAALLFLEYVDGVVKATELRIGAEHIRLRRL